VLTGIAWRFFGGAAERLSATRSLFCLRPALALANIGWQARGNIGAALSAQTCHLCSGIFL